MTNPTPVIDPALAAALDRYTVGAASPDFESRIVDAAIKGRSPARPRWPLRSDRRPWTRRVITGGVAIALCTTALAAALLNQVGLHLPSLPALVAATTMRAHRTSDRPQPVKNAAQRSAVAEVAPPVSAEAAVPIVAESAVSMSWPDERRAVIRERLADLPPAARQALVRRVIAKHMERRGTMVQAIVKRRAGGGEQARPLIVAESPLAERIAERPALRTKLIEGLEERRATRQSASLEAPQIAGDATNRPISSIATSNHLLAAGLSDKLAGGSVDPGNVAARAARIERISQLRQQRTVRQQLRRQRRH